MADVIAEAHGVNPWIRPKVKPALQRPKMEPLDMTWADPWYYQINRPLTISPKGIANGLSSIPNAGCDFGPDTPGTGTYGIQELFDSVPSIGATVRWQEGTYLVNTTPVYTTLAGTYGGYTFLAPLRLLGTPHIVNSDNATGEPLGGVVIVPSSSFPSGGGKLMQIGTTSGNTIIKGLRIQEINFFGVLGGNNQSNTPYSGGLYIVGPESGVVENCSFMWIVGDGVHADETPSGGGGNLNYRDCVAFGCSYFGFYNFVRESSINSCAAYKCGSSEFATGSFRVSGGVAIDNCWSNSCYGVDFDGGQDANDRVTITGGGIDGAMETGVATIVVEQGYIIATGVSFQTTTATGNPIFDLVNDNTGIELTGCHYTLEANNSYFAGYGSPGLSGGYIKINGGNVFLNGFTFPPTLIYANGGSFSSVSVEKLGGYNPVGYLSSQPATSTSPVTNPIYSPVEVFITVGSTATTITKNSTSLGSHTSQFIPVHLEPGESITLSQTTGVSWLWFGD